MNNGNRTQQVYVTLTGLPLIVEFKWPFHCSTAGADFWVLHADVKLANSDGLHASVAVNLSATVREVLPSMEPQDVEGPVVNALRKEVDRKQLEFLKSGKLVPVHFSSRYYDFKRNKWVFGRATDDQISKLIARKVFWHSRVIGGNAWIGDPAEALYVEIQVGHVLEVARGLATAGLMTVEGEHASPNAALLAEADTFESEMKHALAELEKKHAFEDARRAG
jgi:phosphotransferase system HPr-like phosphotransfer protein